MTTTVEETELALPLGQRQIGMLERAAASDTARSPVAWRPTLPSARTVASGRAPPALTAADLRGTVCGWSAAPTLLAPLASQLPGAASCTRRRLAEGSCETSQRGDHDRGVTLGSPGSRLTSEAKSPERPVGVVQQQHRPARLGLILLRVHVLRKVVDACSVGHDRHGQKPRP